MLYENRNNSENIDKVPHLSSNDQKRMYHNITNLILLAIVFLCLSTGNFVLQYVHVKWMLMKGFVSRSRFVTIHFALNVTI